MKSKDMTEVSTTRYASSLEKLELHYTSHRDVDHTKRGHTAVYCGYESGKWNYRQFFNWVTKHILTFALNPREIQSLSDRSAPEQLEQAVGNIYAARHKYENRGELGELILHGLIRDIYDTTPLISKIYRKTAPGDTVKGADCVHVIESNGVIDSLWLGEAKFKTDAVAGIREAVDSVKDMLNSLSNWEEFIVIRQHMDDDSHISKEVEALLSKANSLDDIKAKICVPVLVTYDSEITSTSSKHDSDFVTALNNEIEPYISKFLEKCSGIEDIDVHVFFMPLQSKKDLNKVFDNYLQNKRAMIYEP